MTDCFLLLNGTAKTNMIEFIDSVIYLKKDPSTYDGKRKSNTLNLLQLFFTFTSIVNI